MSDPKILRGTMIDTETLSLSPQALIWEIAAVPFDMSISAHEVSIETGAPLHAVIDHDRIGMGEFDIDIGTVRWTDTKRKGDSVWEMWRDAYLVGSQTLPLTGMVPEVQILKPREVISKISEMTGDDLVWFRNSAFDVPAIDSLTKSIGQKMPWNRRRQSDLYTQINMAWQLHGYEDELPLTAGHRALDDAMGQLIQLEDISRILYCSPSPTADHSPS